MTEFLHMLCVNVYMYICDGAQVLVKINLKGRFMALLVLYRAGG